MTRNGKRICKVEQQRQGGQQATSRHLVIRDGRITGIEGAERRLSVPAAPFSTLLTREESFITDWADS